MDIHHLFVSFPCLEEFILSSAMEYKFLSHSFLLFLGANHHPQNLFTEEKVFLNLKLLQMVNGVVLHMHRNMALSVLHLLILLITMTWMKTINLKLWTGGNISLSFRTYNFSLILHINLSLHNGLQQ
jgi:hypothetical protein